MTTEADGNDPSNQVGAVSTTMQIISELEQRGEMRVSEVADAVDITPSAAHKHLTTLRVNDFLVKSGKTYSLSLRFLDIGGTLRDMIHGAQFIKERIQDIASETGERTQFLVLENGRAVVLFREGGSHAVSTRARVGLRHFPNQIAAGKAMMSELDASEIDHLIDQHGLPSSTENTITDRKTLLRELEDIREQGFAVSRAESHEGLWAVSIPVELANGGRLGAIAVAGPQQRIEAAIKSGELIEELQTIGNEMELNLKYNTG